MQLSLHFGFARDAAQSQMPRVIIRRLHLALFLMLAGLAAASVEAGAQTSVSGMVRDSAGVPQIGAEVQLIKADLTVAANAYTNSKGHFVFASVLPGSYAVKAIGSSFLPSLRENVRVRSATVVNLTLNTLYEVMQWLPAQPRNASTQKDDWAWTLRSTANRPLLRWLEDGPLVVVSEGPNSQPRLKARLVASGQQGAFGEDGERITMEVEDTPSSSRELLARVDFDPTTNAGMESMLGFRQDLGFAGSVESVAAVAMHPEIEDAGGNGAGVGLEEAAVRTTERMQFGDMAEAEVGTQQVMARFIQNGPNTVLAEMPFAMVGWRTGNNEIHYRMATAVPAPGADASGAAGVLPAVEMANGKLVVERGTHQEIGWERRTDASGVQILVYADSISNPMLEASAHQTGGMGFAGQALMDPASGLIRTAGEGFSTAGVVASVEHRLPGGNSVRLSYANGDALVISGAHGAMSLSALAGAAKPRRTQMYSLSLSGTIDGTGTRWRASYRWQPEETLTRVAPYALDAAEPFMNLHVRQPIYRVRGEHAHSIDAMVDARNLLAQGYRSFVLNDGSLLIFAQEQRSLSAGLAFTF
ncbi:carboxypeptidase-like regulatory domain-containing protein [Terracidiphilus gabretensis]|uniref:carboxypeptidase-like regulatory domain-containing protein n=1 Tax=Terracidiphilus gabretensis TaxID=1577687 RepID=UPI0009EBB446|nr:carboxypeptidase-like regulatory domain-containing protein [Terracidiphilus gabretensis]